MAVTQDWMRSWSTLPLTHLERTTIRNVCLQLARGRVHPALDTRPLELDPPGAWIGSPAQGYTITWRPHSAHEHVPGTRRFGLSHVSLLRAASDLRTSPRTVGAVCEYASRTAGSLLPVT